MKILGLNELKEIVGQDGEGYQYDYELGYGNSDDPLRPGRIKYSNL